MYDLDTLSDMINFLVDEYPDIDIRNSKKLFRQREYEKIIIEEIVEYCGDRLSEDVIELIEDYELVYEYFNNAHKNDAYKFQLNVIRKLLRFLRRRN